MSTGPNSPLPVDSGSYGQLVDSLNRSRLVVEDCLTLGDVDGAFSALALYDRRSQEVGEYLRDAARTIQADLLGLEESG